MWATRDFSHQHDIIFLNKLSWLSDLTNFAEKSFADDKFEKFCKNTFPMLAKIKHETLEVR